MGDKNKNTRPDLLIVYSERYTAALTELRGEGKDKTIEKLKTIIGQLQRREITTQYDNHRLTNSHLYELHVEGNILLIYSYENSKTPTLVLLELLDLTDHDTLKRPKYQRLMKKESKRVKAEHEYDKIEESLSHSHNESTLDQIDDLIEDIYELRKRGMESKDGEYSIDNLVFKEFRNLGYLDTLKELRKKEISRELSLEHLDRDE